MDGDGAPSMLGGAGGEKTEEEITAVSIRGVGRKRLGGGGIHAACWVWDIKDDMIVNHAALNASKHRGRFTHVSV